jgi:outer membrane scaffolding protein for murein synthesis (MipA/OmpV family)
MMIRFRKIAALSILVALAPMAAQAGDRQFGWLSGDWYLAVGATGLVAPKFEGGNKYLFSGQPIISLGKAGNEARFVSRNDNISFSLYDSGNMRAGLTGKILWGRDEDDAHELKGLDPIRFGGEIGGFAEVYPTDWLRVRAEVRQGIRSHHGVVADVSADAFHDVTPAVRVSGGPRLSFASSDYFDAYYGVDADQVAASGLREYHPDGGLKSMGLGGAVTWKTTDRITTSLFGEYSRLMGPAADSSLVEQRGDKNQFMIGVSAAYRFDFTIR